MHVEAVRRFNRFYTRRIGALRSGLLGSPYPLPEARLIYELGRRRHCTASELCGELDLDAGYLRLLLVDPRARGRGLGKRLVRECIAFARLRGYRRLVLWTQSNLLAARAIYEACGFRLTKSEPHAAFGVQLTGEYWERRL
jgi:GNAT superfamily N-acetyltransferase